MSIFNINLNVVQYRGPTLHRNISKKKEHILAYRFLKTWGDKMNSLTLKQSPCTFTCCAFNSLFTEFAATTQECTRSHYQDNMRTYHSSQLTPIYPRAFKKRSGGKKKKKRGSDIASLQHHRLVRMKVLPWVGEAKSFRLPTMQCSQMK